MENNKPLKREMKVDVEAFQQIDRNEEDKYQEKDLNPSKTTIETLQGMLEPYKCQDGTFEYQKLTRENLNQIKKQFSTVDWLDQIRFRLFHPDFYELPYPQIKDCDGFKFTKKSHEFSKKKLLFITIVKDIKLAQLG